MSLNRDCSVSGLGVWGREVFYQYYQGLRGIAQTLCFSLVTTYLKMRTLATITKGFAGTQELQTHLLQLDYEVVEALKLTCPLVMSQP